MSGRPKKNWEPADYLSSVELYYSGQLTRGCWPYDLSDPLDRAIWTALHAYVGYLANIDLEPAGDLETNAEKGLEERPYTYGPGNLRAVTRRLPREIENLILELRDAERGKTPLPKDRRFRKASRVLEGLSAPAQELSGRRVEWGAEEYSARRNFWEEGEKALKELEEGPLDDRTAKSGDEGPWPKSLTRVALEHPLLFPERVAPLFGLLERSMGELISQSDAARRLGLTPRGVTLRIERGEMRRVRVGQYVFVPAEDVEASEELAGRRAGSGSTKTSN